MAFTAPAQDAFTWLAEVDKFVAVLQIAATHLTGLEDVVAAAGAAPDGSHGDWRNCQDLWIGAFQATSVSVDSPGSGGVMSMGRSSSLPLWKVAPARTRATRC